MGFADWLFVQWPFSIDSVNVRACVLLQIRLYQLSCLYSYSLFQMFADRGFSAPLHRTANYLTHQKANSTYMYTFEFDLREYDSSVDCGYWHGMISFVELKVVKNIWTMHFKTFNNTDGLVKLIKYVQKQQQNLLTKTCRELYEGKL